MTSYRIITEEQADIGLLEAPDAVRALAEEARLLGFRDLADAEARTHHRWSASPVLRFTTNDAALELWTDDPRIADLVASWSADEARDADMVVDACRERGLRGSWVAAPGAWGPYRT